MNFRANKRPTGYTYLFLSGVKSSNSSDSVGTGSVEADANIQIYGIEDSYRLLDNYKMPAGSKVIDAALNAGDILRFDYCLTLGETAAKTSYTVRLQNLTTKSETGVGTVMGVDASIYNALTGTGAFGFIQTINLGGNDCGINRRESSFCYNRHSVCEIAIFRTTKSGVEPLFCHSIFVFLADFFLAVLLAIKSGAFGSLSICRTA